MIFVVKGNLKVAITCVKSEKIVFWEELAIHFSKAVGDSSKLSLQIKRERADDTLCPIARVANLGRLLRK